MFRKLRILPLAAIVMSLTAGCIKEDRSMCHPGVTVSFEYVLHNNTGDLFGSEVSDLTLYIFDGDGTFLMEYVPTQYGVGNTVHIPLEGNQKYTIVAWGGEMSAYTVGSPDAGGAITEGLTAGVTNLAGIRVALREQVSGIGQNPTPLFYGMVTVEAPLSGDPVPAAISVVKNTSTVRFRITDVTEQAPGTAYVNPSDAGELYGIDCRGDNNILDHTNDIAGDRILQYLPADATSGGEAYQTDMDMMRLIHGDDGLKVTITDEATGFRLLDEDLVKLIQEKPAYQTQEGLDREDLFLIELEIDRNNPIGGNIYVVVKVNGWTVNPVDPVL